MCGPFRITTGSRAAVFFLGLGSGERAAARESDSSGASWFCQRVFLLGCRVSNKLI